MLQQYSLRAGHLSAGLSAISVATPAASTVLGVTLFDETLTTSGFGWVVLALSVIVALAGVLMLARSSVLASPAPAKNPPKV